MKTKLKLAGLGLCFLVGIVLLSGCITQEPTPQPQVHPPLKNPITSSVEVIGDMPMLVVNNKTIPITGFFIYQDLYSDYKGVIKYIDYAAENGFSFVIVSMWWHTMDTKKELAEFPEDAAKRIDWTKLDSVFDYAASKGVYVIPAFRYYCSPPEWWYQTNNEQNKQLYTQTNNNGETTWMPSFNAKPHEEYADQVITYMVNRYRNHPALLGWELGFGWTVENNYPSGYESEGWYDYSPFSEEQFRDWLKKTYNGDVSSLRKGWGDNTVTLENAEIPQPLPPRNDLDNIGVNGAGDTRRQFYDWQVFRLEQKKKGRGHFAKLFEQLDPEHVLFADPGGGPLTSGGLAETAYALNLDYYDYASSPYIDGIFICPGLTDNQELNDIYALAHRDLINYMHKREKITFVAWEDWGVTRPEILQRNIIHLASITGTGIVLSTGGIESPTGGAVYEYSENEIEEVSENQQPTRVFTEASKKIKIAFVDSPFLSAVDYQEMAYYKGEYWLSQYKGLDAFFTAKVFSDAGLEYDVLSEDEIVKNPDILNDYAAIGIIDLFRMTDELKDALVGYRNRGGGLFIVGRSAVFDEYGNHNLSYLQQLLNISSPISEYGFEGSILEIDSSWSFVTKDKSGLISRIEGHQGDGMSYYNILNIPTFDYEKEGYKVIGTLNSNPKVATVGYKGKVVFWFPRLGMQIYDRNEAELKTTQQFLKNLYAFYRC